MSSRITLPKKIFVSVDSVIFGYRDRQLFVPLFRRRVQGGGEPFPDCWSLPGGPLLDGETFEAACRRKLEEDIGLKIEYLEQLYTFGAPERDPRDRAISVSYFAFIRWPENPLVAGRDAREARWFPLDAIPTGPFAFDHREILDTAIQRLRGKLLYQPIGLNLLDDEFSMADLLAIYEAVLPRKLDRRNFSKKILSFKLLTPSRVVARARGRPTQLFRFDRKIYQSLQREGFSIGT